MIPNSSLLRRPTRRLRGIAVAAVALLGALGCGGGGTDCCPMPNLAGTYNVVSTSGPAGTDNAAPFVLYDADWLGDRYRIQIPGGSMTLTEDRHYSGTGTAELYIDDVLQPDEGGDSFPSGGTYSVSGTTVTFTSDDGSEAITATMSGGNTLTFTRTVVPFGTFTLVARK